MITKYNLKSLTGALLATAALVVTAAPASAQDWRRGGDDGRRSEARGERPQRSSDDNRRAERVQRSDDRRSDGRWERREDRRTIPGRTPQADNRQWDNNRDQRTPPQWDRNRNDRTPDWNRERNRDDRRWDNDRGRYDNRYDSRRPQTQSDRWYNDWRRDRRYDWQSYRNQYRDRYRIGTYYSPYRNYGYSRLRIGLSINSGYYGSRYWIRDPYYYRLPPVPSYMRWVRYYDDVVLVDLRRGRVVDVIYNFFW